MASVFKRGRWIDAQGRKCAKSAPGAKWVESRFYTVQVKMNGRIKRYTKTNLRHPSSSASQATWPRTGALNVAPTM